MEAVRRDRLASLFALLERRAPGHRPYLLVVGLDRHIQTQDRRAQQADLRAGPQVRGSRVLPRACHGGGGGPSGARQLASMCDLFHHHHPTASRPPCLCQALGQVQQSARPLLDDFIAELAVECPRLGFRDAVDAAQVTWRCCCCWHRVRCCCCLPGAISLAQSVACPPPSPSLVPLERRRRSTCSSSRPQSPSSRSRRATRPSSSRRTTRATRRWGTEGRTLTIMLGRFLRRAHAPAHASLASCLALNCGPASLSLSTGHD